MEVFRYEAMNRAGQLLQGKLEAENEMAAVGRLIKMGYTVLSMSATRRVSFMKAFETHKGVSLGEMSLFSKQLASLLGAGIPLTRALYALSEQSTNKAMRTAIGEAARNVEGGMSFSESLHTFPDIFSSLFVDMIRAGEASGNLEGVLLRLADQFERDKTLRDNIKSAMMYPTAVLGFAVVVLVAMLYFVVPVFVGFFPAGVQLPLATRIVMAISDTLRHRWYIVFPGILVAVMAARMFMASDTGRELWDRVKFRVPLFGPLIHKATIARFSRTLATLLTGGIPVLQALERAGPASGSRQVTEAARRAGQLIQEGTSIAVPFRESRVFPPMVTLMVSVGEETGELADLLAKIAEFYESEVATITKGLTGLIEPLMIIFVGSAVGGAVIALYLPIFTVVTQFSR